MGKQGKYPYEDCRDLRHAWKRLDDVLLEGEVFFSRTVECIRCGTTRIDVYQVAAQGQKLMIRVGSHYHYPKDYSVRGRYNVEELRWRLLKPKKSRFKLIS
jgi:hypothetical protein